MAVQQNAPQQDEKTVGFYSYSYCRDFFSLGSSNRDPDPKKDTRGQITHYDFPTGQSYDGVVFSIQADMDAVGNGLNTGIVYSQGFLRKYQYSPSFQVVSEVPASCVTRFEVDASGNQTVSYEVTAGPLGVPGPVLLTEPDEADTSGSNYVWPRATA